MKDTAIEVLHDIRQQITKIKNDLKDLNRREGLLGIEDTDGSKAMEWDKNLKPFEELWSLIKNYTALSAGWTRESIFKQDADGIATQAKLMLKSIMSLSTNSLITKLAPLSSKIAQDLADDIKKFQKNIPIIAVFANPGLKQRHFEEISKVMQYEGDPLGPTSNLNLNKVVGLGAADHLEELEVISETAAKEYMIESTLSKVKSEWEDTRFELKRYKESFVHILTGASIEEVQSLVDDHSLKVLTMKGSVYARTFEE